MSSRRPAVHTEPHAHSSSTPRPSSEDAPSTQSNLYGRVAGNADRVKSKIGATCSGYGQKFIWLDGDETVQNSEGRRVLECESTWSGLQTLPPDLLDLLVTQFDDAPTGDPHLEAMQTVEHNPFSTFTVSLSPVLEADGEAEADSTLDLEMDPSMELIMDSSTELAMSYSTELVLSPTNHIPHALEAFPDITSADRSLFHHYVNHVAVIMMPYEHARNPWKLHYPAVAQSHTFLDQSALYHAMLSQAAFNISDLRAGDSAMAAAGSRHYAEAIRRLVSVIGDKVNDFGSLLASIMTLIFAETYSGESQKWRHHLQGAWRLFNQYRTSEPWKVTDFVCVSIQSLNIIRVISETSIIVDEDDTQDVVSHDQDSCALDAILSTFDFGFTIGASPTIVKCIANINEFRKARHLFGDGQAEEFLETILVQLKTCLRDATAPAQNTLSQGEDSIPDDLSRDFYPSQAQHIAFVYATYIYLYRSVLNVPPQMVQNYVNRILELVSQFFSQSCGNFSIWPAFMAAVEATSDTDIMSSRTWLAWATSFGIGSRGSMERVVEEVWRRRNTQSELSGIAPAMIAIDWRVVMQELGCDVLLV